MDPQPKRPNRLSVPPSAPLDKSQEFFSCSYPDCHYKSNWEENVGRHEWGHNPTGLDCNIPCQVCPQVFLYLVSFLHHMTSKHSNKLFCPWCLFLGEDLDEFKGHILAHIVKPPTSSRIKVSEAAVTGAFQCVACSKKFVHQSSLSRHQKKFCALNAATTSAENTHAGNRRENSSEISNSSAFQFDPKNGDDFKAPRVKSTSKNIRKVKPKKPTSIDLRCNNCSLTFTKKPYLLRHQKNVCRIALLRCDKCGYRTSFAQDLRKHISIHLAGEQLKCRHLGCYYKTLWTQSLRKHQRSCKIRIPAPETLNGISKPIEILMKEVKMAEGGSEDSCSFCSFKSTSRSLLKRHFMTHVGSKPLRCGRKGCEYEAKSSQTLRHHIRRDHSRKGPKAPLQTKETLGLLMECEIKTEEETVEIPDVFENSVENSKAEESKLALDNFDCSPNNPDEVQNEEVLEAQRTMLGGDNSSFKTLYLENLDTPGRIDTSEKPFKCPNLGCAFMTCWPKSLQRHQRSCQIQIPTEAFDQAAVDKIKTEGTTETLMEKEKAINGETLFYCSLCSFKSKWEPSLKAHLRTHSGHQPFRCPFEGCKYQTKWSSELRKHLRILPHFQVPVKAPLQTEDKLRSDRERKIEGFVSSTTITYACVLCEFIGHSELSALKHSCEHKTAVISLSRIGCPNMSVL